jgi:cytochrome P450
MADKKYLQSLREQHGDVVKLWIFQDLYQIFDPEMFMGILRQEWNLPYGAAPNTWPFQVYYKEKSEQHMPMMLLQGEAWKQPRHTLQTHMFSPKAADAYQPGINAVVQDASKYLGIHHRLDSDAANQFLMNVSFEMLAQVLLDRRMGLVDTVAAAHADPTDAAEKRQFVSSAVDAFHALGDMLLKPPLTTDIRLLRLLPVWNKLEQSMDHVWDIGMKWLQEAEQQNSDTAFVTKLAGQGNMGRQERLVNLITLLQAGVDTTSNSLSWAVIELARRPEIQERLRHELAETIPTHQEDYHRQYKLPYLKAFMRELQRCSPAAGGNMRTLPFDVQAGEYRLQKNSIIMWNQAVYGHDPELLGGDPTEFKPERWLTYDEAVTHQDVKELDARTPIKMPSGNEFHVDMAPAPILSHPLMTTAFGVGPRMCVGSRVAQNEMHSFLSRVVRDFEISLDPPNQEVGRSTKLLQVPDPFPSIRFDPIAK